MFHTLPRINPKIYRSLSKLLVLFRVRGSIAVSQGWIYREVSVHIHTYGSGGVTTYPNNHVLGRTARGEHLHTQKTCGRHHTTKSLSVIFVLLPATQVSRWKQVKWFSFKCWKSFRQTINSETRWPNALHNGRNGAGSKFHSRGIKWGKWSIRFYPSHHAPDSVIGHGRDWDQIHQIDHSIYHEKRKCHPTANSSSAAPLLELLHREKPGEIWTDATFYI